MHTESFPDNSYSKHARRLLQILDDSLSRSAGIHRSILENQSTALEAISGLIGMKSVMPTSNDVFSKQQMEEFAVGSIARCFGPDYAVLDRRPAPRIPNGRLLLMDRVIEIIGKRMEINPPASIVTEVDVPADAWYLSNNLYHGLPLAILMEMALQPCGILSAYLGTSLMIPPENHLFRNLDGWISLTNEPDLRGKTITNRAELINSVASGGLFIQSYRFSLSVEERVFLEGESSFGYFTPTVMKNQSGLDLGEKQPRLIGLPGFSDSFALIKENHQPPAVSLDLSEMTWTNPAGGRYGKGVVVGERSINPEDWYFTNHFFGDPVMPGSLGVEAITRGLAALASQTENGNRSPLIHLDFPAGTEMRWKYRGQVLPVNQQTYYEAHIKQVIPEPGGTRIVADADFWVDALRIYSLENLSIIVKEGNL